MSDTVLYRVDDGVAVVTLNRPERLNAWSVELELAYAQALDAAAGDPEVRAVVVTGAGRGFCAGADLSGLSALSAGGAEAVAADGVAELARGHKAHHEFEPAVPKPVIAAINGACAGLGLVHALLCDLRFAAEGAKLTTAFVRRGLIAEHGIAWTMPRIIGLSRSLDLLLSGRTLLAEEALGIGLVDRVVPGERLLEVACGYARELATWCSPRAMAEIKDQLWRPVGASLAEASVDANRRMLASFAHRDFAEGVSSYLDKRPPSFAGLGD